MSLGLDTFAVAVGIGMRERDSGVWLRVSLAFAAAEALMTFLGSLAGGTAQALLGSVAGYAGFAALVAVGIYMIVDSLRKQETSFDLSRGWGLLVASLSISLDSLGIGFSIVYIAVPLVPALITIFTVSALSAALGLALGRVAGERVERYAGQAAGALLILTGVVFAFLHYTHAGLD